MTEIVESLQKIGLSDKEARVYLALLKIGDATVKDISSEADIKRPTTYLVLEELRQKGLILKIPHVKKAIYQAKNTDGLFGYASENMSAFKRALPKIQSLQTEHNPVKTFYFEGLQGLKDALFYRVNDMKEKTITGFFSKDPGLSKSVLDIFTKFNKALIERNTIVNGITPEGPDQRKYQKEYPEFYKNLSFAPQEDYSAEISIEATDDFIRIIDGVEMKAVIIESKRVADAVKQIFNIVKRGYDQEEKLKPEQLAKAA